MRIRKKETTGRKVSESGAVPEPEVSRPRLITERAPGESYAPADWQAMFADALPLLEKVAAGQAVSPAQREMAARLIVRHYIAMTSRPGLAKTRLPPS